MTGIPWPCTHPGCTRVGNHAYIAKGPRGSWSGLTCLHHAEKLAARAAKATGDPKPRIEPQPGAPPGDVPADTDQMQLF